jgi:hypothetical protein
MRLLLLLRLPYPAELGMLQGPCQPLECQLLLQHQPGRVCLVALPSLHQQRALPLLLLLLPPERVAASAPVGRLVVPVVRAAQRPWVPWGLLAAC